jgi:elongation factor G
VIRIFFTDTKLCMQAVDSVVFVVDAVDGVKVQTEQAWEFAEEYSLPSAIVVNKLDRERADFTRTVADISECFESPKAILLQLPIGSESDFKGIVDLLKNKAYTYDETGKATEADIPGDMADDVSAQREALIENLAEADDELLEKFFEEEPLSDEELTAALKQGIRERAFVPVFCASAQTQAGTDLLADFIVNYMPAPSECAVRKALDADGNEVEMAADENLPFAGFVFKTVADPYAGRLSIFRVVSGKLGSDGQLYNSTKSAKERFNQLLTIFGKEQKPATGAVPGSIVAVAKLKDTTTGDTLCDDTKKVTFPCAEPLPSLISFALTAKSKGDEDKIFSSLSKLLEEDMGIKLDRNSETKEILLSGRGQVHIEATTEKLKRKFNVEVVLNTPKVPYRETIKKKVRVQGRHKKQTGGHGQFGDCWIVMEPMPRGEGFQFVDAIVGGAIPKTYIPAVEKGIVEAAEKGPQAGFPCVDFRVTLDDGSFHQVDSSEMAFKIAGALAYRKAVAEAKPVLLEPIMSVTVTTPDEYMGDIMGDLNGRRGRVLGMDSAGKNQVIKAQVPMAEFLTYAPDLRSMTGGRGMYTMEFSHYDEVPAQLAEKIIEEANREKE